MAGADGLTACTRTCRACTIIGDGNALAVELGLFRRTYNTLPPHQALDDRTPRQAYVTGTGTQ